LIEEVKGMMTRHFVRAIIWTTLWVATCAEDESRVHVLTDANFDAKTKDGIWMIKFYAPWCGHCKRLAPIFESVAASNERKEVHFGKLDATKETTIASRFNVNGYPRLMFKTHTEDTDLEVYTGGRTEEGLSEWLRRMSEAPVKKIEHPKDLDALLLSNDIIFMCIEDDSDAENSCATASIFETVALRKRATITFASASSASETVRLLEFDDRRGTSHVAKIEQNERPIFAASKHLESVETFMEWVEEEKFALVNVLDRHNFKALTKTPGKKSVIAVIDMSDEDQKNWAFRVLRRLARPASSPLASTGALSDFRFGILDGVRWKRFVGQFFVTPDMFPHVFVLDGYEEQFYQDAKVDEEEEIESFVLAVAAGKVYAQREGWKGVPGRLYRNVMEVNAVEMMHEKPFIFVAVVFSVFAVFVSVILFFRRCTATGQREKRPPVNSVSMTTTTIGKSSNDPSGACDTKGTEPKSADSKKRD